MQKSECSHPLERLSRIIAVTGPEDVFNRSMRKYYSGQTVCSSCGRIWGIVGTHKLLRSRLEATIARPCRTFILPGCTPPRRLTLSSARTRPRS